MAEVDDEVGCDWHTVMDAVVAVGGQLVDRPDRTGQVRSLGLDETLFAKLGRFRMSRLLGQLRLPTSGDAVAFGAQPALSEKRGDRLSRFDRFEVPGGD